MKYLLLIIISISSLPCFGQAAKFIDLQVIGNINFKTRGLATNDAGVGINLDAALFSTHKLQLLVEGSSAVFIGDKLLVTDSMERKAESAVIHSITAGLQYFISKKIAVSVLYGFNWHRIRAFEFTQDDGYKFCVTGFTGNKKRTLIQFFMVDVPRKEIDIRYFGIGIGYKFYQAAIVKK